MRTLRAVSACFVVAAGLGISVGSKAEGLHAVRPIPGYACMQLNLTEKQMFDYNSLPPVREQPSSSSHSIGVASGIVITENPVREENGFVAMMLANGKKGWVAADKLQPYHSSSNPPARCVPSIMSNGRIGLAFPQ
ncbi:hypothetical protein RQ734_22845 [Roseomonas mucosa]|uniref:hypothetical protein n=1 Tax=Roseomonas mucosa TaxID=207340 RepID=UPI0028CBFEBC|nr:hypothetical protein [Roseomonas mucosa]MDT8278893.1 hypothetical protein [Roseomonas mucosa]